MTTGLSNTQAFFRGATIEFQTTFYDVNGAVVQPASANLIINYATPSQSGQTQTIAMTPPPPGQIIWTAILDTRGMLAPASVDWSIETPGPIPVAVEDGTFNLTANRANQLTF